MEYLELGDNRIKKIENLSKNIKIKRLFLGANQIFDIENLEMLENIEVLSLPANAIQEIKVMLNFICYFSSSLSALNSINVIKKHLELEI